MNISTYFGYAQHKPFKTRKILLTFSVITAMAISSCDENQESNTTNQDSANENTAETCFYTYNKTAGAQVRWTAFKTTEKVAVGGQFNQVNVSASQKSTKITDILRTIKFNIPTSSTNTANEERDAKIITSFFGAMDATDLIIGQVKDASGDNNNGTCIIYLTLNNVEQEIMLDYTLTDVVLQLTGTIDLLNFSAENAVASLNEVCKDLHKGEDGITKIWSVVELSIKTTLTKECH